MSWFDLDIGKISYTNPIGSAQGVESVLYGFAAETFANFSWWFYFLCVVSLVIVGYLLFFVAQRFKFKIGSFWKVALVLSAVVSAYVSFFVMLLWEVPFGLIAGEVREGTFGDSFGTLNALFSGLAFSGVLITLLIQQKDLSDAREQSARQQTESQFYNMLNLQQQVIQGFDLHVNRSDKQYTLQGRDCFRDWHRKLHYSYDFKLGDDKREQADVAYVRVLTSHQGDLGLYFRSLYSVFRFIELAEHADKKHFSRVVRSLLSDFELVFLYYNCLSGRGEKFQRFANCYKLFDNLDIQLLLEPDHVLFMDVESFGNNEEAIAAIRKLGIG